tara:strand:- start:634 stop:855 length:222 start_codon:yes stop_codon:yes gene_type:complete
VCTLADEFKRTKQNKNLKLGEIKMNKDIERITKLINNINNTQEGSTDCIIYEKYGLIAVLAGELKTICEKGDK